jgi:hypothetical protein
MAWSIGDDPESDAETMVTVRDFSSRLSNSLVLRRASTHRDAMRVTEGARADAGCD